MERMDTIYKNAKNKSVKPYIKVTYKGQTAKLSKKKLKKAASNAILTVIVLTAAIKIAPHAYDKINHQLDVKDMALEQSSIVTELLVDADLNTSIQQNGTWGNDYSKINGLSEEHLYGFNNYLGHNETEKIIRTLGYDSWDNYLVMNGYLDKYGNPSVQVWENYEEARLVNQMNEVKEDGKNI